MAGRTTENGYGWPHQRLREELREDVEAGDYDCWRCVERRETDPTVDPRIHPWQDWDLGHDDTDPKKRTYKGPEHKRCNRRAGGEKGAARRGWVWHPRAPRRDHPDLTVDPDDL